MTTQTEIFEECWTPQSVDAAYKAAFFTSGASKDLKVQDELQEAARRAHVRIVESREKPSDTPKTDSDRLNRVVVRQWAMLKGVVLGIGGRVTIAVENEYRAAHDLPPLEKTTRPVAVQDGFSSSSVRTWARETGIEVGTRGRLHPDVIAQYKDAHK